MNRRFIGLFLIVSMQLAMLALAPEAMAHHPGCGPSANETDLTNWTSPCREFIVDSGFGTFMDRQGLLARQAIYTSGQARFTPNFLWYSRETQIQVDRESVRWTGCAIVPGPGNACPPDKIRADHNADLPHKPDSGSVLRSFDYPPSVTLSVFEFGDVWVAKACGNWSDVAKRPNPVPTISGIKYHDTDRDGVQDSGEGPLGGFTVRIDRIDSLVGQPLVRVAELTTDANGRYHFALDNHGPGTYRVTEVVPAGWKAYTEVSQDVIVPFGAGDSSYTVNFGNAETTTDVAKTTFEVIDPPARLEIDQPSNLTVRSTISNDGPAGPVDADEVLTAVHVPVDCTLMGLPPRRRVTLAVGQTATFDDTLTVTCARRSFHRFGLGNDVQVATRDVTDIDTANNHATIDVTLPVFEETTLSVDQPSLICDEYWAGEPFTCSAAARITNSGTAPSAQLHAALTLGGSPECVVTTSRTQEHGVELDGGQSQTVSSEWTVDCSNTAAPHTFTLLATAQVAEPHLEAEPASVELVWIPLDIKPDSDPNSLNVGRPGLVSVALLSTADLSTPIEVDRTSLRFGPTGTEAQVVRCGEPEDANGDGLFDLVCKFSLSDARSRIGDTVGIVTGVLMDGTPFMGADRVRII